MGRVVPHQYKSQEIVISFVLDPSDLSDKMCLNVRAPDFILKDMSAGRNSSTSGQASSVPDTNCTVTVPAGNRTVNVTSESGNEVPHGWCPEGTVFRIGLEGDPSWTVDLKYAHEHRKMPSRLIRSILIRHLDSIISKSLILKSNVHRH